MYYIGIDTSCYTSSIAIVDDNENIVYDGRVLLQVPPNNRGLRQSEAVYQHSNNLPKLCAEAMKEVDPMLIKCIGVSSKPRSLEDSYMPVFIAGSNLSRIVASCIKAPVVECSHQQGHMIAGAWSINKSFQHSYLVYHISGGTTELLLADDLNETAEIIGGTEDLNAGQYIDRVGVSLGLSFPCGKQMDKLCDGNHTDALELPLSVKGTTLSFSGPESHVQRLISKVPSIDEAFSTQISKSVFLNIAKALEKTILNASAQFNVKDVLMVGGVASNNIIRKQLLSSAKLQSQRIQIYISLPQYSSDNAVGAAIYAKRAYQNFGGLNGQR